MGKDKYDDVHCGHVYRLRSGDLVTLKSIDHDVHSIIPFAPYPPPPDRNTPFPTRRFDNEKWDRYGNALNNPMNDIIEEFFPKVDLSKCVGGEELIDQHGYHLIYVGIKEDADFPHLVLYPDGSEGSRCNNGKVYKNRSLPTDHDIVEVLGVLPHKVLAPPEPNII
jgi:hypothetical protein